MGVGRKYFQDKRCYNLKYDIIGLSGCGVTSLHHYMNEILRVETSRTESMNNPRKIDETPVIIVKKRSAYEKTCRENNRPPLSFSLIGDWLIINPKTIVVSLDFLKLLPAFPKLNKTVIH